MKTTVTCWVGLLAGCAASAGCNKDTHPGAAEPSAPPVETPAKPTRIAPPRRQTAAQPQTAAHPKENAPAPEVSIEEVTYSAGAVTMKGFLAYPPGASGKPGVLVVHEWWGHNDYARQRARMLAEAGYTALAVDMYGEGKNTEHPSDAKTFMQEVVSNMDKAVARF